MNILLVQPSTTNMLRTHVPKSVERRSSVLPPLGLLYIAAMFKNTKHNVAILDCDAENLDAISIKKRIEVFSPAVVGITSTSFTLLDAIGIAKIVKDINTKIAVVLGGAHCSIYPSESISLPMIDYLVIGEGETAFLELVEAIEHKNDPSSLYGIAFKSNTKAYVNPPATVIENLNDLPFPDRRMIPRNKYYSLLSQNKSITTMSTSRGCPFDCLFCYHHTGRKFRALSPKRVVDEMFLCKKEGYDEIFMVDDTFTIDRKRIFQICDEIKMRKLDINWDARAHINTLDQELVRAMRESGCVRLHIGIEAGTEAISKILRKNINFTHAKRIFEFTKSIGIQTLAYFMIGSPTETKEQIYKTIDFAIELDPDYAQFSVTTPFPCTDLYIMGLEQGVFQEDYWKRFANNPYCGFSPSFWTEILSEGELLSLTDYANRRFYSRPSYLFRTLRRITSLNEFTRKCLAGIRIFFVTSKTLNRKSPD